ncbi:MAG TPA: NAD-dependent malic enzyme [Acholeplasmatales bacterium]|nr:NAD-dependent malic enzyme [Acholeplasmatales bacterium]
MDNLKKQALEFHRGGKIAIASKVKMDTRAELSLAYTPGVAYPCLEINKNKEDAYLYTSKANTIAVITDGTAVLGLGDIGPEAAMPVMEGKCLLFKKFAGIDAIPICLNTKDTEEIIKTVAMIAPSFGGINLEDISFPRCVEIEKRLNDMLDIPVFHDDQRGTAVVVGAALINAARMAKKPLDTLKVAMSGMGAAGSNIAQMLRKMGVKTIYGYNIDGIITKKKNNHPALNRLLETGIINSCDDYETDALATIVSGADVFIGVSVANVLTKEMVNKMADRPIIFALANPNPEIDYPEVQVSKAFIYATGRSDYPNQINNVLAFPGIFKGVLATPHRKISWNMCVAASRAIAELITEKELKTDYIIPSVFDERVVETVSKAVRETED